MIETALRYQTQGRDWIKRIAIGGGLVFFSFLLVPIFTFYGYTVEIMRRVVSGDVSNPPEWGELDIVEISIDGLKYFAIAFVYGLAIGMVFGIPSTVLTFVVSFLDLGIIGILVSLIGFGIQLVGGLLLAVITPIMVVNFAVKEDIAAGFDLGTLRAFGTNRHMLKAIGIGVLLNIGISIVALISFFTIVGPAIVSFVGLSAVSVIWAKGYADAYEDIHGERPTVASIDERDDAAATDETTTTGSSADAPYETGSSDDSSADAPYETGSSDDSSGPTPDDENRWE